MLVLLSFIAVILIVVSVHEYGHYLAARWCGVRVLRFSVGFGKPLLSYVDQRRTEWVFAPILLGGYVRLLDKDAIANDYKDCSVSESVEAQSPPRRILIYFAGPLANIILAFVLLLVLLSGGERGLPPQVESVRAGSVAAAAGIAAGDELNVINGSEIVTWRQAEVALADVIIAGEAVHINSGQRDAREIAAGRVKLGDIEEYGGSAAALGMYPYEGYISLQVATVLPDSAAAKAGIRAGDELVMLDGVVLEHWRDAVDIIVRNPDKTMLLLVRRDNIGLTLSVTPAAVSRGGRKAGYLGVGPAVNLAELEKRVITVSYSLPGLVAAAASNTAADISRAVSFLQLLISGNVSPDYVSGPVGIAAQSGEAAARGISVWLRFVTLISISLGILNLLPLPLLDGGQIVLTMLQWMSGRAITENMLRWWHISGGAIILLLMVFVIVNDITRLL